MKYLMLRKSSDRQGYNEMINTSSGKLNGEQFYQFKHKKKKSRRDNHHNTINKSKDMVQTTSPMQQRQAFKKKKSKNKLSGILNISSA